MDELRASTPDERRQLKSSVRRAAKLAGGAASVQHVTRASEYDLSKYASLDHPDRHCPIDVALELDREAGGPVIVALMARLLGFKLVAVDHEGEGDIGMGDLAGLTHGTATVIDDLVAALADGRISEAEERVLDLDIERAVGEFRNLQHKVHRKRATGNSAPSAMRTSQE